MSFGSKGNSNTTPQPTFTQQAQQPTQATTINRAANSAEAQDRAGKSTSTSLLAAGAPADEELKKRNGSDGMLS